jgi:hypothetical protein
VRRAENAERALRTFESGTGGRRRYGSLWRGHRADWRA